MITLIRPFLTIDTRFLDRVIALSLLHEAIPNKTIMKHFPNKTFMKHFGYRVIVLSCYRVIAPP